MNLILILVLRIQLFKLSDFKSFIVIKKLNAISIRKNTIYIFFMLSFALKSYVQKFKLKDKQ